MPKKWSLAVPTLLSAMIAILENKKSNLRYTDTNTFTHNPSFENIKVNIRVTLKPKPSNTFRMMQLQTTRKLPSNLRPLNSVLMVKTLSLTTKVRLSLAVKTWSPVYHVYQSRYLVSVTLQLLEGQGDNQVNKNA